MIFVLIVYFVIFFFVIKFKKSKPKSEPFPMLKLNKNGVSFFSKGTHSIKVDNIKTMLNNSVLYIKIEQKLVIVTNVKNVMIFNNKLYFTSCGETKIIFDCNSFYRYFALKITSHQFCLDDLKQLAIKDLINSNFNLTKAKTTRKYINIIENILNIHISDRQVIIKPNRFKFSFNVTYKVNNKIKRVNINQTL